jgi:hypothetical protein
VRRRNSREYALKLFVGSRVGSPASQCRLTPRGAAHERLQHRAADLPAAGMYRLAHTTSAPASIARDHLRDAREVVGDVRHRHDHDRRSGGAHPRLDRVSHARAERVEHGTQRRGPVALGKTARARAECRPPESRGR